MPEYTLVKNSQILLFKSIPLYHQPREGVYALYKNAGDRLNAAHLEKTKHPDVYILNTDKKAAMSELIIALNTDFKNKVAGGNLREIRETLEFIVEEALAPAQEKNMNVLPETLDILLGRFNKNHEAMKFLSEIASNSPLMVTHTVNVMALTLQFCIFHKFTASDMRQMAIAALLHDVGCSQLNSILVETDKRLTDKQFETYTTHPAIGHAMIIEHTDFDTAISAVAMEHHERLDGSGYPQGIKNITTYSQIISIIDCYEYLTYRSKSFRKKKKPFDALALIKEEVLQGKFSSELFKIFTSCLVKK